MCHKISIQKSILCSLSYLLYLVKLKGDFDDRLRFAITQNLNLNKITFPTMYNMACNFLYTTKISSISRTTPNYIKLFQICEKCVTISTWKIVSMTFHDFLTFFSGNFMTLNPKYLDFL